MKRKGSGTALDDIGEKGSKDGSQDSRKPKINSNSSSDSGKSRESAVEVVKRIRYNEGQEIGIYDKEVHDGSHPVYRFLQSGSFDFDDSELGLNPRNSPFTCADDEFASCFVFYLRHVLCLPVLTQRVIPFTKRWSTGLLHAAKPVLEQRFGIKIRIKTLSMTGGKRICLVGARIDYAKLVELMNNSFEHDLNDNNEKAKSQTLQKVDAASFISEKACDAMVFYRSRFSETFMWSNHNTSDARCTRYRMQPFISSGQMVLPQFWKEETDDDDYDSDDFLGSELKKKPKPTSPGIHNSAIFGTTGRINDCGRAIATAASKISANRASINDIARPRSVAALENSQKAFCSDDRIEMMLGAVTPICKFSLRNIIQNPRLVTKSLLPRVSAGKGSRTREFLDWIFALEAKATDDNSSVFYSLERPSDDRPELWARETSCVQSTSSLHLSSCLKTKPFKALRSRRALFYSLESASASARESYSWFNSYSEGIVDAIHAHAEGMRSSMGSSKVDSGETILLPESVMLICTSGLGFIREVMKELVIISHRLGLIQKNSSASCDDSPVQRLNFFHFVVTILKAAKRLGISTLVIEPIAKHIMLPHSKNDTEAQGDSQHSSSHSGELRVTLNSEMQKSVAKPLADSLDYDYEEHIRNATMWFCEMDNQSVNILDMKAFE